MTAYTDRILGPLRALIAGATARVDYFALYSAVVNSDNQDETLDFTPEDSRFPSQSKVPKMYGLPGLKSTVASGSKILFGFANGDPSKPYVSMYDGTSATKLSLQATMVNLGSDNPAEPVALGQTLQTHLSSLKTWADTLVLPSAMGPAGPPAVPSPTVPTVTATNAKVL